MAVDVIGTGVLIRPATDQEQDALESARRGHAFTLQPERSFRLDQPARRLGPDEVYVVSQAFVDFVVEQTPQRWHAAEHHGHDISLQSDPTKDLLRLADETAMDGLADLLSDLGIAGLKVSRWALFSAPQRIELTPDLEARLAPLRR